MGCGANPNRIGECLIVSGSCDQTIKEHADLVADNADRQLRQYEKDKGLGWMHRGAGRASMASSGDSSLSKGHPRALRWVLRLFSEYPVH